MRGQSLIALVAASVLVGGCSGYGELRSVVGQATPADAERIGECQEFGVYGVIDDPVYGCAYFIPGTQNGIAEGLAQNLARQGFDARCQEEPFDGIVELNATRGNITVTADVSKRGSIITMSEDQPLNISDDTRFVSSPYRTAPPGTVIVKLEAGRYESRWAGRGWADCIEFLRARR